MTATSTRTVTVVPDRFELVLFDAASIARLAGEVADAVGIPPERDIRIEVDERTPLGRTHLVALDPVTITAESGAFEDPTRLRRLSEPVAAEVLGRFLFRAADRLDPSFGEPPPEPELSAAQVAVWDVYSVGRLSRRGWSPRQARRRYQLRTRLGFTDAVDRTFDTLWHADDLTWSDLEAARLLDFGTEHDRP